MAPSIIHPLPYFTSRRVMWEGKGMSNTRRGGGRKTPTHDLPFNFAHVLSAKVSHDSCPAIGVLCWRLGRGAGRRARAKAVENYIPFALWLGSQNHFLPKKKIRRRLKHHSRLESCATSRHPEKQAETKLSKRNYVSELLLLA